MNIVYLLNHPPCPRIMKRMEVMAEISNRIEIIFWKRFKSFLTFPEFLKFYPINIPHTSNIYLRIIYDILLILKSLCCTFKFHPNLIYIDGIDMILPAFIYKLLSLKKVILVLEIADISIIRYREKYNLLGNILEKLTNLFVSKVDLLILTSPYFWSDYYSQIYPHQEKVIFIENVPEKSLFENFKSELYKDFVIGFIGFIRYVRQLEILFEACKELENVRIIVAGGGSEDDRLREVVKNYKNVYFLGPYDYRKDILKLYSPVDLVYAV